MKLRTFLMGAASAALVAGAAVAQETTESEGTDDMQATEAPLDGVVQDGIVPEGDIAPVEPMFNSIEEMTVDDVIGTRVISTDDTNIGEIDYVIDQGAGPEIVIGIGGFLGLGEYTVALPVSDFELDLERMVFVLPTDKETLKAQPEFDESGAESLPGETLMGDLMAGGGEMDAAETEMDAEEPAAEEGTDDAAMDEDAEGDATENN